jgi:hypothetical protein
MLYVVHAMVDRPGRTSLGGGRRGGGFRRECESASGSQGDEDQLPHHASPWNRQDGG